MHPVAYIFMGFGALLALIGVIVFVKMGTQGTSTVKMFGFEFRLGGSALVIFVMGVLLFMVPVIYNEKMPQIERGGAPNDNENPKITTPTARKLPYVIFNKIGDPRVDFGVFKSDKTCLEGLFTWRQKLDEWNASRCGRLPSSIWCLSYKDGGSGKVYKDCSRSIQDCKESLSIHQMEAAAGTKRIMTSCEQISGYEFID